MATEFDTARNQYEHYRYCYDNGHKQFVAKARVCFDFWDGNQWDAVDKAKLDRAGRPALTFNTIEALVRSAEGIQRALRNDVRFLPVADAGIDDAKVRDAIWMHVQSANQLDFLETEVFKKGLIMSRAFYDVRVSFDDSFQGNIVVDGLRSQDVVLDPVIDKYSPDGWPRVFTRRWVSYYDLIALYGKEKADAVRYNGAPGFYDYEDAFLAQQMGRLPYYHIEGITDTDALRANLLVDQQFKVYKQKEVFVDLQTGDTGEVPETWDRERVARVLEKTPGIGVTKRKVETVRWVVTCEGTVMHEDDSPYKWFTVVPYFPNFVDGVTKGAVESLLDPQKLFNKITSQELHIINTTANSGYKVKSGALLNMTLEELEQRGAESGIVLEVSDMDSIEKFTANSTPQGHDRISYKADKIMRDLMGVSQQARGFAREDVAGEAILANQAAQEVNLAGWLSNLHRTKQILASRVLDAVQAHYTDTRVLMISKGSLYKPDVEPLTINELTPEGAVLNDITRGKYTTTLVPAPSRTSMSEEDFKLLLELRKQGVAIPDAMLIELSPAANKGQIIQMMQGDSNEAEQAEKQADLQRAAAEMAKLQATARKEETAAALNAARAQKFLVEANTDPDEAYERVEQRRIDMEAEREASKLTIQQRKLDDDRAFRQATLDVKREKLALDRQQHKADQDAALFRRTPDRRKP